MNRYMRAAGIALIVSIVPAVATVGCSHGHTTIAHIKKAEKSATANPTISQAIGLAQQDIQGCVQKIGILHILRHPAKNGKKVFDCAVPKTFRPAVKACVQKKATFGKGTLIKDQAVLAGCLVSTGAVKA